MLSSKKPVGFHLTYSAVVDTDTGGTVQMSCNAPEGSGVQDLAHLLAVMREAAWREQVATNERILAFTKVVKDMRSRLVEEAKEAGKPLDEDMVREEDQVANASIARLESKVLAGQRLLNGG